MAIVSAKYNIQIPETDVLSYIFDAPFGDGQGAWPFTEPLLHSTEESEPCYTIDEIKNRVTHLGCGLHHLGAQGTRVLLYGEANIHFPLALLGVMAGGAACAVLPPSSVHQITFYLRLMNAAFILCGPNDVPRVVEAAREVGIPHDNVFVVDEYESVHDTSFKHDQIRHWSWLLNFPDGDEYAWPRLGSKESKETEALMLCTSGYVGVSRFHSPWYMN